MTTRKIDLAAYKMSDSDSDSSNERTPPRNTAVAPEGSGVGAAVVLEVPSLPPMTTASSSPAGGAHAAPTAAPSPQQHDRNESNANALTASGGPTAAASGAGSASSPFAPQLNSSTAPSSPAPTVSAFSMAPSTNATNATESTMRTPQPLADSETMLMNSSANGTQWLANSSTPNSGSPTGGATGQQQQQEQHTNNDSSVATTHYFNSTTSNAAGVATVSTPTTAGTPTTKRPSIKDLTATLRARDSDSDSDSDKGPSAGAMGHEHSNKSGSSPSAANANDKTAPSSASASYAAADANNNNNASTASENESSRRANSRAGGSRLAALVSSLTTTPQPQEEPADGTNTNENNPVTRGEPEAIVPIHGAPNSDSHNVSVSTAHPSPPMSLNNTASNITHLQANSTTAPGTARGGGDVVMAGDEEEKGALTQAAFGSDRPCDSPSYDDFTTTQRNGGIRSAANTGRRGTNHSVTGSKTDGGVVNHFDDEAQSTIGSLLGHGQQANAVPAGGSSVHQQQPQRRYGSTMRRGGSHANTNVHHRDPNNINLDEGHGDDAATAEKQATYRSNSTSRMGSSRRLPRDDAAAVVAAVVPSPLLLATSAKGCTPTGLELGGGPLTPSPAEMAAYSPYTRSTSKTRNRIYHDPRLGAVRPVSPMRLANDLAKTLDDKHAMIQQQRDERFHHFLEVKEYEERLEQQRAQAKQAQMAAVGPPMRHRSPKKLTRAEQEAQERALREQREQTTALKGWQERLPTNRELVEERKQREMAEHEVVQPPLRFGETWTPPADEEVIEKEAHRRALEREAAAVDEDVPGFQRTTTTVRVHEAEALERRKAMGNIMLTEDEYNEILREEEAKQRKKEAGEEHLRTVRSGAHAPTFMKTTELQKTRQQTLKEAAEAQPAPKPRLLPGSKVKVSERLLRETTSVAAKKTEIVAFLESTHIRQPTMLSSGHSSPLATGRGSQVDLHGTAAANGGHTSSFHRLHTSSSPLRNPTTCTSNNSHNTNPSPLVGSSGAAAGGPVEFSHTPSEASHHSNMQSVRSIAASGNGAGAAASGPAIKMNASMAKRVEANRLKVEKMKAEQEAADRLRVPLKKEEQLLSFERLQSSLMGGSSNGMRFT